MAELYIPALSEVHNPVHICRVFLYLEDFTATEVKRIYSETCYDAIRMDEGRKRVIGIMAAILASLHMQTADDLFGGPQGSPRTDRLIVASIQWAQRIMRKIDELGAEK
jgi:hypothetical protein